jgi:hypothetical protein
MIGALITILIVVLIIGLIVYIADVIPLPPPFAQIIRVVAIVIGCIIIIMILAGLMPGGPHLMWR